jgi:hypothetical protein
MNFSSKTVPKGNHYPLDNRYYLFKSDEDKKIQIFNSETQRFIDITKYCDCDHILCVNPKYDNTCNTWFSHPSNCLVIVLDTFLYLIKDDREVTSTHICKRIIITIKKYDISFDLIKDFGGVNITLADNGANVQLQNFISTILKNVFIWPIIIGAQQITLIMDINKMEYAMHKGTVICEAPKTINNTYKIPDRIIPISDSISKTSVLFDLVDWIHEDYIGEMTIHTNNYTRKKYYLLYSVPPKMIYKYKRIESDIINFNVEVKDSNIYLTAVNEDKTKEYVALINNNDEKYGKQTIELLYEKISDAIYKKNNDIFYTYVLSDTMVELTIEIRVRYNYETIKCILERKPYNELEILRKQVEYMKKKMNLYYFEQ